MSQAARGLKHIHELNIQLRTVQEKLERGPKRIHAREQLVEKKTLELETAEKKLTDLKLAAKEKNSTLQSKEGKIADLQAKLNAAATNVEYDTLRRQIEADTAANEVLEMEILDSLERVDQQQIAIKSLKQELDRTKAELEKARTEVAAEEPGLSVQAKELSGQLDVVERELPGEILERYRRLVKNHGADALAVLDSRSCSACFTKLAPQDVVNVNTGKFVFCRACGRLLYRINEGDGEE
jgi:predicted  nucleic acid-binding Zn-ribbon protein